MTTKVCSICKEDKSLSEYHNHARMKDGRQSHCKTCGTQFGLKWTRERQFVQKYWSLTRQQFYDLPKKIKSQRTALARKYYEAQAIVEKPKKTDDLPQRKSLRSRGEIPGMKPLVPEGWVYIISNPTISPTIVKIGKTYPNGLRDRLSEARRWGRADLLHKEWFANAVVAEKAVHWLLREHKVIADNAGEELFEIAFNVALDAVLTVKENIKDDTRKAQEMEEQAIPKLGGYTPVLEL